jgi:hypothetical protein
VVDTIADGALTKDQARRKLAERDEREKMLKDGLAEVDLANTVSAEQVRAAAQSVSTAFGRRIVRLSNVKLHARVSLLNDRLERMTFEEGRELVQVVFAGKTPAGERFGVRVQLPADQERKHQKTWRFNITGRLVDTWGTSRREPGVPAFWGDHEFQGGPELKRLLAELEAEKGK